MNQQLKISCNHLVIQNLKKSESGKHRVFAGNSFRCVNVKVVNVENNLSEIRLFKRAQRMNYSFNFFLIILLLLFLYMKHRLVATKKNCCHQPELQRFFFKFKSHVNTYIFMYTDKNCIKPLVDNKDYIDDKITHQNMGKPASKHFLS